MADRPAPSALNIVNEWLTGTPAVFAIVGREVDYKLAGAFPAIRVTDVGPMDRGPEETLRRIQIECWADDYDTAWNAAAAVDAAVSDVRGDYEAGYCAGGSVESGPTYSPDTSASNRSTSSDRHRWLLDVALWLYPTG